jgi:hypothetical protein
MKSMRSINEKPPGRQKRIARRGGPLLTALTGILGILLTTTLVGCGGDGSDGKAYIAYTWLYGPISFYTEDPAFETETYIYNGEFRETRPGEWYFEYLAWDDSYWYGTYEIYINEGESGGLFSEGEDGGDLYFQLAAYSIGPSLYVWDSPDYVTSSVSTLLAAAGAGVTGEPGVSSAEDPGSREISAAEVAGVREKAEKGAEAARIEPSGEEWELSADAKTHIIEDRRFTLILRYEKGEER